MMKTMMNFETHKYGEIKYEYKRVEEVEPNIELENMIKMNNCKFYYFYYTLFEFIYLTNYSN